MKTLKEFMTEAYRAGPKTTALLPATRALFNKNKASVSDIGGQWDSGKTTVQVAHVYKNAHEKKFGPPSKKVRFIVGYGHGKYEDSFDSHHDQTGAKTGHNHIVNTIHLQDGKVVHKDNELHVNDKAEIHVYK